MSTRSAKFVPTAPDKWPTAPLEVQLPSGARVLASRPNIFVWHKTGQLPDEVWATIIAASRNETVELDAKIEAINWLITRCVVDPSISIMPREGSVCIDDIDDVDREFLMVRLGIGLG